MQHSARLLAVTAALALTTPGAHAAVTISSAATQNMSCSNGVCAPTDKKAVLNVGDLKTLLASANVEVTTTGSGVQANDIVVSGALSWASSSTLSLDAHRSVAVNAAVSIAGLGGLTLDSGKKGTLSFGKKGDVNFVNLSSQLTINGGIYTLVGDIKTLANDIASNPSGKYALAQSYDADKDGTYRSSPIPTEFTGRFEGLNNAISNLSIRDKNAELTGLFGNVDSSGVIGHLALRKILVTGALEIGGLVGLNHGLLSSNSVSGRVHGGSLSEVGGLVGNNYGGSISDTHSACSVSGGSSSIVGGLVGQNYSGTIEDSSASGVVNAGGTAITAVGGLVGDNTEYATISNSYATGVVTGGSNVEGAGGLVGENGGTIAASIAIGQVTGGTGAWAGGLVGFNYGSAAITNSYANGAVTGGTGATVGGLIGFNGNGPPSATTIDAAYSTGSVTGGSGSYIGGFIGDDSNPSNVIDYAYWDTDTSGITNLSQGAGNVANDPGITGLTTAQFQSGLPAGFDPAAWAENPSINGGLPYLLSNLPPK